MFDHVYLNSLIIILVVFTITIGVIFVYEFLIKTNRLSKSWKISLREYSVYIKYNFKTKKYSIENIQYIEIESMEKLREYIETPEFHSQVLQAKKTEPGTFNYVVHHGPCSIVIGILWEIVR